MVLVRGVSGFIVKLAIGFHTLPVHVRCVEVDAEADTCASASASGGRGSGSGNGGTRRSLLQRTSNSVQAVGGKDALIASSSFANPSVGLDNASGIVAAVTPVGSDNDTADVAPSQQGINSTSSVLTSGTVFETVNHSAMVTGRRHVPKLALIGEGSMPIIHHSRPRRYRGDAAPMTEQHAKDIGRFPQGAYSVAKLVCQESLISVRSEAFTHRANQTEQMGQTSLSDDENTLVPLVRHTRVLWDDDNWFVGWWWWRYIWLWLWMLLFLILFCATCTACCMRFKSHGLTKEHIYHVNTVPTVARERVYVDTVPTVTTERVYVDTAPTTIRYEPRPASVTTLPVTPLPVSPVRENVSPARPLVRTVPTAPLQRTVPTAMSAPAAVPQSIASINGL